MRHWIKKEATKTTTTPSNKKKTRTMKRNKKEIKPALCSQDLLATPGNLSRALNGEGPPRMRSKCRLQPLAPPCNGPRA